MWIITCEVNDYRYCGEYFHAAFKKKPTKKQLYKCGFGTSPESENIQYLLNEEGKLNTGNVWFYLKKLKKGKCMNIKYL